MRLSSLATGSLAATALLACHPSVTIEHATPVASLQTYRSVAVRVSAAPGTQGQAAMLEMAVLDSVRRRCSFDQVVRASAATPGDVVVDLNIVHAGRGNGGLIQNPNLAVLDTLLVLSDGTSGELLGSAQIHGQSSQVTVTGQASPEQQAIDVVARSVGEILGKSGCSGPRAARAPEPPPPATGSAATASGSAAGSAAPPEPHRAEADALNKRGELAFRSADIAGAMTDFQQANALAPDPRYVYNLCLAHEGLEQWDDAIATCRQAQAMQPRPELAAKIDHRIELLQQRKAAR